MDDFKKYLQQNREQMDVDTPPVELLTRIQKQSVNRKGKVYSMFLRVVAAACFAAGIFWGVEFLLSRNDKEPGKVSSVTPVAEKKHPASINSTDTQQLVKVENPEKPIQQRNTQQKRQMPLAYQLLNSFEKNYTKLVSLQLKSIRNTPVFGESPEYFDGFKMQMHQINEDEYMLKVQIKRTGLHDELLEQLINVYQQKINLLKSLLQEISNMNNKIKENRQPADSARAYYLNI